ncbi:MAG: S8 family serine peptidase [Planctomycetota bacterium]|nr:S8 family serine peptidase [Planctomycetota bacterium]
MTPRHINIPALLAGAWLASSAILAAQDQAEPRTRKVIALFEQRSFDLTGFREAILERRSAAEIERLVADLDAAVLRDQEAFVEAVAAAGGKVRHQWWVINGAAIEIPSNRLTEIEQLANIRRLVPDTIHRATLREATGLSHHRADQANQMMVGGKNVRGDGLAIAILDTGIDADMGGTGRPHRAYYRGGNPSNHTGGGYKGSLIKAQLGTSNLGTEDQHGHGTFVSGCANANNWDPDPRIDDGVAPGAWVVSIKMANNKGEAFSSWIISAWQLVARHRVAHNIAVANNSFSGSPKLDDPVQLALDSTARNADVLITVSAGNKAATTTASQSAFNGIAVGSVDKKSKTVSSFSAQGPLHGSARTYPDMVAVGKDLYCTLQNSEQTFSQASGTSFAAPLVAGTAALIRQAEPRLSAIETKAILLNTTEAPKKDRNAYGLGILRCDRAVTAALTGDVQSGRMTNPVKLRRITFGVLKGITKTVTLTWLRRDREIPDNLDLRIYDDRGALVVGDLNPVNGYEKVSFTPVRTALYRADIAWTNPIYGNRSVNFAISGLGKPCLSKPVLTGVSPNTASHQTARSITLTGTNFNTILKISVGDQDVRTFTATSPTKISFLLPKPTTIGLRLVNITTSCGTSNALTMNIHGSHPGTFEGPAIVMRGSKTSPYDIYSDAGWRALVLLSPYKVPSRIPNVVDLGIGSHFLALWEVANLKCDGRGHAQLILNIPKNILSQAIFFQAIPFDPKRLQTPLETTNVLTTSIF